MNCNENYLLAFFKLIVLLNKVETAVQQSVLRYRGGAVISLNLHAYKS